MANPSQDNVSVSLTRERMGSWRANCYFITLMEIPLIYSITAHRLCHKKLRIQRQGLNGKAIPAHVSTSGHVILVLLEGAEGEN